MSYNSNKILKEGYGRLKKILEKLINTKKEQPRLVLQPVRNQPSRPQDAVSRQRENI
jgi:hypothetical protein